jgi:uncharacterized protein (DUF1330 family)
VWPPNGYIAPEPYFGLPLLASDLYKSQANIKEYGGKYLAGSFNDAISLKGYPPPNRVVILEFPDMDALKAFHLRQDKFENEVSR